MAITLVGSNTGTGASNAVTIDLSGIDIQTGDVVYAASSVASNDFDITEDSGTYQQLADLFSDDTVNNSFSVWRKVQGATPDTAVTITNGGVNQITGLAIVLRGVDNTTPEDATPTTATAISSGTADPPAIDTVTAGAWVIAFAGSSEADAVTNAPSNYTNLVDVQATNANVMAATREIASPGTEDPGAFTDVMGDASDCWCACTVAVRPAAEEDGRTGTMAATEAGADDATVAGDVIVEGNLAVAETGNDTFAGTGTVTQLAAPALTYGAGRLSRERVEAKYREIEEIERRIAAKEEAEHERVRKVEETKRQLADLAEKKRQTKTIADRRRKLEARIKADEAEILALRNAIAALVEQIELTQTIADRRRRMVLLLAAAA